MARVDGDWHVSARAAAPELRPYVAGYTGYRQTNGTPGQHRGLPSPYLTMIVALDDPLMMVAHPDPADPGGDFWTLIGGLHTRPALIGHPGRQAGVQIALRPLGARALFGLPAGELSHRDVPGDALLGPLAAELHERVHAATGWAQRFAAIDRVLCRRLRPDAVVRPEVTWAWAALGRSQGRVRIGDLAAAVGLSARHLDTVVRRETGLGPKAAARVFRFDRAKRLLYAEPRLTLAEAAARCGYFDQSHLAREFRELAGCPPSTWLAEERTDEFRNVQDEPEADLADLAV
jgi:AraC-like DNA-binding protein